MNHQGRPELLYLISITTLGGECCAYIVFFPGSSDGKESTYNTGDPGLIPGSGRSPGEENGYPLQENPMDRGGLHSLESQRVGYNCTHTVALQCSISFYRAVM